MRIYRGSVGIEMTLEEFSELIVDDEKIDDMLVLLHDMEMDEIMYYSEEEVQAFEQSLIREIREQMDKTANETEEDMMRRIIKHLRKYD